MGVTKESPPVKLFDGWFDERTYFESDKPPIKVSDILDFIYSTLSEHAYEKINNETIEEYDDEVKELIVYSNNDNTKKHYQRYETQYQDYTKNHRKLKLDSPINVANF
eukprot:13543352-Ditylum_brightwellii.AAC.1